MRKCDCNLSYFLISVSNVTDCSYISLHVKKLKKKSYLQLGKKWLFSIGYKIVVHSIKAARSKIILVLKQLFHTNESPLGTIEILTCGYA
jgi:hypothetical protein